MGKLQKYNKHHQQEPVLNAIFKRPKIVFHDQLLLHLRQKHCRMHFEILSIFIKLPFVIQIFILDFTQIVLYVIFRTTPFESFDFNWKFYFICCLKWVFPLQTELRQKEIFKVASRQPSYRFAKLQKPPWILKSWIKSLLFLILSYMLLTSPMHRRTCVFVFRM